MPRLLPRSSLSFIIWSAALLALSEILWLWARNGGGRVRETGFCWLVRRAFLKGGEDPFDLLPGALSRFFDFSQVAELAGLLSLAFFANLGVALAGAAVLFGAARKTPWQAPSPLALGLIVFSPAVLHPLGDVSAAVVGRRLWGVLAGAAVCGVVFRALMRRSGGAGDGSAVRPNFRAAAALPLAFLALGLGSGAFRSLPWNRPPQAPPRAPNLLLISIDSLRRDHLHCYGYPRETSPNLDRLAAEGVRFETAVSPASWTLPAHMTLLTGLSTAGHQVNEIGGRLPRRAVTLAEALRGAGYATHAIVVGPLLQAEHGFSQGFADYNDYAVHGGFPARFHKGETSSKSAALAGRWLREWAAGGRRRPFFLFLHLWDVHFDYTPPSPYDRLFDPGYTGPVTGEHVASSPGIHAGMAARDLRHLIALYDGEIRHTDAQIGRVLDELQNIGGLDDTVVAVTADHGDEFFEHGDKLHGRTLYDEVLLVPLILRFPGRAPAGEVVSEPVRLRDVAPTLLSLLGVEAPRRFARSTQHEPFPARDLTPLFAPGGPAAGPSPPAFGELRGEQFFVRTSRWKVIEPGRSSSFEVYNLADDPGETVNLGADAAREAAALRQALAGWRSRSAARPRTTPRPDPEHLDALRSLGYIQ